MYLNVNNNKRNGDNINGGRSRRTMTLKMAPFAVALSLAAVACGSSDAATDVTVSPVSTTAAPADDNATAAAPAETMSDDTMSETMADDTMSETMSETMADDTMSETMADDTMSETMADDTMSEAMSDDAMSDVATAAFQSAPLIGADGVEFTLNDLRGKTVFVENFATWCGKCQAQLVETNAAAGVVGDDAIFLAISVETQLSPDDVAAYATENNFSSTQFAVMTPEFLATVTEHYGGDAANPPSTPHFIIDSHGAAGEIKTGAESAADIDAAVRATS